LELSEYLNEKDKNWRDKYLLMVDNASYHRSNEVKDIICKLRIPFMYLGPY
jgi:hypothetical protein